MKFLGFVSPVFCRMALCLHYLCVMVPKGALANKNKTTIAYFSSCFFFQLAPYLQVFDYVLLFDLTLMTTRPISLLFPTGIFFLDMPGKFLLHRYKRNGWRQAACVRRTATLVPFDNQHQEIFDS